MPKQKWMPYASLYMRTETTRQSFDPDLSRLIMFEEQVFLKLY